MKTNCKTNVNFCARCGNQSVFIDGRIERKRDIDFDVYDEFAETLAEVLLSEIQDYQYNIPNKRGFGHYIAYDGVDGEYELSHVSMVDESSNFRQHYGPEFLKLKEVFGENNVSILYGILNWYY